MNDIETFLNQRNHAAKSDKVSVLEPYKDEIFQLKNMGYAEKLIVEFLAEMKGINISRQALNQFIRSRSAQMQNTAQKTPPTAQNGVSLPTPNPTIETPQHHAENALARRGLRKPTPTKKFNWEDKADPETLK
ncbi:TPA: hypothetical protein ACJKC4_000045 [Neisseria meningitidis]|uniref:hypothetical protein n=1 Tax=Neisseria meningitidis TaxID=487 RepID=UPI00038AE295|nr:hypothetical protein [Neisseria meningitidis]EQD18294.1 hypothetical protein NM3173_1506 [Neisseria meningitidis NM3173]CWN76368.1 Uncharacterised protein [Neisseria meningitidis]CWR65647.1 Uncharacterised protein [Neisseria meningitidis]